MSSAAKLIAALLPEEGYCEKASNSQLDSKTANSGYANFTKYARDLDAIPHFFNGKKNGYAWCAVFVAWGFVQAFGVDKAKELLHLPEDSCGAGVYFLKRYFQSAGGLGTAPKVGALVFFAEQHTGVVVSVDGKGFTSIEGNTSPDAGVVSNGGSVCRKTYASVKDGWTFGYPEYTETDEAATKKPRVYLSPAMHRQNECCYARPDGKQCYEALENNEYVDILQPMLEKCGIETLRGVRRTPMSDEDGTEIMYRNIKESNAWKPDVHYVSHTNASTSGTTGRGTAKGFTTMYYPNSTNGKKLAELMVKHRKSIYPYGCTIKTRSDLHELSDTDAPAIYMEHVFHDNLEDAAWFHRNMTECAVADCKALCEYLGVEYAEDAPEEAPAATPQKKNIILYGVEGDSGTWERV